MGHNRPFVRFQRHLRSAIIILALALGRDTDVTGKVLRGFQSGLLRAPTS